MATITPSRHSYLSALQQHYHQQRQEQSFEKRRVSINDRCGEQRRPLPSPSLLSVHSTSSPRKKKSVRFCSDGDLEQVRLFIRTQIPLAAQSDPPSSSLISSSTLKKQKVRYNIRYPGWPSRCATYQSLSSEQSMIRLENIQLTDSTSTTNNKRLMGRCRVSNVAYEKQVVVRYSFNDWKTYQETEAFYREPVRMIAAASKGWDRFIFEMKTPPLSPSNKNCQRYQPMTCWMALRYNVIGQEFWDNNNGKNYQVDIIPTNGNIYSSTPASMPPLQLNDDDDNDGDDGDDDEEDNGIDLFTHNNELEGSFFKKAPPASSSSPSSSSLHTIGELKSRYNFSNASRHSHHNLPNLNFLTVPKPTDIGIPNQQRFALNYLSSSTRHASSRSGGYQDFVSKYCFLNPPLPSFILQT